MNPFSRHALLATATFAAGCLGAATDGAAPTGGGPRACAAIGCWSSVDLPAVATLPGPDLLALDLRLCRNDVCAEGRVARLPEGAVPGPYCALTGNPEVICNVRTTPDGRYRLDLGFRWQTNLRDGDRYEVRVVDRPTGAAFVEASEAVRYATSTPNGPGCEPTCQTATLTLTRR